MAAAALLFFADCNNTDNTYRELRYFYTMLNPALPHQTAIVDRSYSSDEAIPDTTDFGVPGARIVLTLDGNGDSTVMVDSTDSGLYRTNVANWVMPGSSYTIHVTSDSFQGQARVRIPGSFRILFPPNNTHFTDTNSHQPVLWTRSQGCGDYRVLVQDSAPDTVARKGVSIRIRVPILVPGADTAIDLKPFGEFDSSGTYYLKVYAIDSATAFSMGNIDTIGPNFLGTTGAIIENKIKVYYQRTQP